MAQSFADPIFLKPVNPMSEDTTEARLARAIAKAIKELKEQEERDNSPPERSFSEIMTAAKKNPRRPER